MWIGICIFISLHLTCNQYSFCTANPLIGKTVRKAGPAEFPFIVSISIKNYDNKKKVEQDHFCGGSLITTRHVLTAAHCMEGIDNLRHIIVKVGSYDLRSSKVKTYGIKKFITYEEWASNNNQIAEYPKNDIAILKLSGQIDSKIITPGLITTTPKKDFDGKVVETAGWGERENGTEPRFMRAASLRVISYQDCAFNVLKCNPSKKKYIFEAIHLCTVSDIPVTLGCGDSGSPLLFNKTEIIAINHGTCYPRRRDGIPPGYQNVHVSIEIYREFIENVTTKCKKSSFWCWDSNED